MQRSYPLSVLGLLLGLSLFAGIHGASGSTVTAGEKIYRQQCASCHGAGGEGSRVYKRALIGDRSVNELAVYISKEMPPGQPKKCTGANARAVAAYIHSAFYSPVAQARNRPARIELSRLTVRQYRSSLADLIGSFRRPGAVPPERGLKGEYYKARRFVPADRVVERIDSQVQFDFGLQGPEPVDQFNPREFAIRWSGSVLAPETGEYEFVLRTEHAARLWVNDLEVPLIDAWVRSGDGAAARGTIQLLGGRAYSLRLDFSKANQGVNDAEKAKDRPIEPASIQLGWKLPGLAETVIPNRLLLPVLQPEVFVSTAPFPPDDRSRGYEVSSTVSREWEEATSEGAIEAVGYLVENLPELTGIPDEAPDRAKRLREFAVQFATRAYRRPLHPEELRRVVEKQFAEAPNPDTAVRRVLLLALKSPHFLYRELGPGAGSYQTASRLSYILWDSIPDAELLKAAGMNRLSSRDEVTAQAARMIQDPRARSKIREFFLQWLRLDTPPDLTRDPKKFPGFDDSIATDLRTSLDLSLEEVIWGERSGYRDLLLNDRIYLNGRLAKFYGVDLPEGAPFQPVPRAAGERGGILTHPYVLATFAYLDTSSPIHRGVMVARSLLGRSLQPPPEAVAPTPADLHPGLTTRQRVALQTKPAACMSCHQMINSLGFALENFDAAGRFRTSENGKQIDNSGVYRTRMGDAVKLNGALDLARHLAGSKEAHGAFVEQFFQFLVKQPVRAYGSRAQQGLEQAFEASGRSIRRQAIETAALAALDPQI